MVQRRQIIKALFTRPEKHEKFPMSNYPDGTSANDPRAPWNQPDAVTCPECGEVIHSEEHHADGCRNGQEPWEIEEDREAAAQEAKFDALRDDGKL